MSDLIQAVKGTALSVAEYFTPVLKQSKFRQTGVLTPEEFVIAGDHLVHQCPTWSWSSASDSGMRKSYLPVDKQYLVTKSVPCYKRCKDIEYCNNDEKIILTENDEEGWVDTHHSDQVDQPNEIITDITTSDETELKREKETTKEAQKLDDEDENDDQVEDMDEFMNMVEDNDTVSIHCVMFLITSCFSTMADKANFIPVSRTHHTAAAQTSIINFKTHTCSLQESE